MKDRRITPEKVRKYAHILSHVGVALFRISEVVHDTALDIENGYPAGWYPKRDKVIEQEKSKERPKYIPPGEDKQDLLLKRALERRFSDDDEEDDDDDFFANLDKMSKKRGTQRK